MTDMEAKIRADLATIREAIGCETDDEAAGLAVQTLADHLRNGRLVMSPQDLTISMVRYATYVASLVAGELVELSQAEDGSVLVTRTGEPIPPPPSVARH